MSRVEILGGGWLDTLAAQQWNALARAFAAEFGSYPFVKSAGRDRAEQQKLYDDFIAGRGSPAHRPGLSLHEYGRAIDVHSGVQYEGTRQHEWMEAHAPAYGWAVDAIRGEPWHLQFTLPVTIVAGTSTPIEEEDDMKIKYIRYRHPQQGDWYGVVGTINHSFGGKKGGTDFAHFTELWGGPGEPWPVVDVAKPEHFTDIMRVHGA